MLIRRNEKLINSKGTGLLLGCVKNCREYQIFYNAIGHEYIVDDFSEKVYVTASMKGLYFDAVPEKTEGKKPWPQVGDDTTKGKVVAQFEGYSWLMFKGRPASYLTTTLTKPKPTLPELIAEALGLHGDPIPSAQIEVIKATIEAWKND